MATVSNPATLSSVIATFGGTSLLSAYLRGGSYVKGIANAYPSVATSLPLSLAAFAGTVNPVATLAANTTSVHTPIPGQSAYAEITLGGASGANIVGDNSNQWRFAADNADFDVYLQKTSGTTPAGSAVNTWMNLSTNRAWSLSQAPTNNSKTFHGTLSIRMNASPQTTLTSGAAYIYVQADSNQCPTCCFTPETLITMADGSTKPIVMVQTGEWILTVNGGKKAVTEIITRTNRVMYEIRFADGRTLNASEDHPLYVVDKGYAAINPGVGGEYKDLGIPDMLYVGDSVLDQNGRENQIVSIELIDYPETVYTFAESEFYANGMLVY